ncbi:GOLPH3/VPS74 family protein [Nonomuraea candida]|uniref:GOLPH3/VPS74 family protein n=1 Tax=Nonomuraea candida TaxID=359159 RepID=UPI0005BE82A1|nr:GPP34 family phosphoprotein [Nonomuraea candida]
MTRLPLHHDLYLLAHDQSGKPLVHASSLALGLAGAALLDLLLAGRIVPSAGRLAVRPLPSGDDPAAGRAGGDSATGRTGGDGPWSWPAGDSGAGQDAGDAVADGLVALAARGPDARSLLKRAAAADLCGLTRDGLLASGVLVRVSRRRLGMLPYTRHELADIASVVRASSGVRSAVEGWKPPDARCAGLCGLVAVLRLEEQLYLDQPAGRLVARLREIATAADPPVGELVEIVDVLVAEAAVAVYR